MRNGQEVIDYLQETYSSDLAVQSDINGGNVRHSHIDLIILDLNLPGISGMDVLKSLKGDTQGIVRSP